MTRDPEQDASTLAAAAGPAGESDAADLALSGDASGSVIEGAAARGAMYVASTGLIALAFAFVFRATGPEVLGDLSVAIAIATIAQNIGDTAVSAVAQRLLVEADAADRPRLQAQLVGFRFLLLPPLIAIGVAFGVVAGYDAPLVWTILVVGISTMVTAIGASLITPLNVELRAARASLVDFTRQIAVAVGLIVAVILSASLVGYGTVYLVASGIAVVLAVALIDSRWRRVAVPTSETIRIVAREAAWLGLAIVVNSLFLKLLTVLASLLTTRYEVGLFAAATRVTEVLAALPLLMASVAYPLLSRAALDEDHERFANATHRIIEGVLLLIGLAVVVTVTASEPIMRVFAGEEFVGAAPVLEVQAFALLFAATTQALIWSLLALRAERLLVITNLVGLAALVGLGLGLIGAEGARGAAWAAVGGELVLVIATFIALGSRQRSAVPSIPKALITLALTGGSVAVGLVLPVPPVLAAVVAAAVFSGGALVFGLVPAELRTAAAARLRPR